MMAVAVEKSQTFKRSRFLLIRQNVNMAPMQFCTVVVWSCVRLFICVCVTVITLNTNVQYVFICLSRPGLVAGKSQDEVHGTPRFKRGR